MKPVALADKYELASGRIFLTGVQALVRLPIMQRRFDRAAGRNTAGFVSGYRGSPLGGLDRQLSQAKAQLDAHDIVFQPGINEDLAATAVWGTQQVGLFEGATRDGIFAYWYGKSPGVDRSGDAFKHANFAGTSALGGVLAIAGDDPGAKSSTLPSQSEFAFIDAEMPVLNPADVAETLEFGLLGWAMSRFCGAWVGIKALADTMDSTAVIDLDGLRTGFIAPSDFSPPPSGLHIRRATTPLQAEAIHRHGRLPAAQAFALLNGIDRVVLDAARPRLGIVATGKSYLLVRQALLDLGIDATQADALGIRILKVGMTWPLIPQTVQLMASGLEEILVVEERRSVIEPQLKAALYGTRTAPRIVGKCDEMGKPLLSDLADLDIAAVTRAIASRIPPGQLSDHMRARLSQLDAIASTPALLSGPKRVPYYCSGCPHSVSTNVPQGSRAIAGIGCHWLATQMPRNTTTPTHMGAEGVPWLGQAPFTNEQHIFANLGDGTYFHSGLLAIRWAIGAKVNVTYKILFNAAIAMTGGQWVEGELSVPRIAAQLRAEGVEHIAIVSDAPDTHRGDPLLPAGVTFHHRRELESVQVRLRDLRGVTALIYDQVCATEKRRLQKRGKLPSSSRRMFINERVCEGCGDCSAKSNCLSVEPVDTAFGRKRQVNQYSCNTDFSCAEGFCPSFVSVEGGTLRRPRASDVEPDSSLPPIEARLAADVCNIVINGIGGQGVTSVAAILGMAAHLEGKNVTILDTLGLAQKGGAVYSFVRVAERTTPIHGPRISAGCADLLLSADLIETNDSVIAPLIASDRTNAIVNSALTPTAAAIHDSDAGHDAERLRAGLAGKTRALEAVDASAVAIRQIGDPIYLNIMLLGFACERGWLPVGSAAILQAIELNGESVTNNRRALALGRLAARHGSAGAPTPHEVSASLEARIALHRSELEQYQHARYAADYVQFIQEVAAAEQRIGGGSTRLTEAVANQYFRLLAYKDEYEVARLYASDEFGRAIAQQFEGGYRLAFHLSPPLFARRDPLTGEPRKYRFGGWMLRVFRVLSRMRFLRGTILDPFGWTAERRLERRLAHDYRAAIAGILPVLRPEQLDAAIELALLPARIRGFGHIKARRIAEVDEERRKIAAKLAA